MVRARRFLGVAFVTTVAGLAWVEPLITHRFALDEIAVALEAVRKGETVKAWVIP